MGGGGDVGLLGVHWQHPVGAREDAGGVDGPGGVGDGKAGDLSHKHC